MGEQLSGGIWEHISREPVLQGYLASFPGRSEEESAKMADEVETKSSLLYGKR